MTPPWKPKCLFQPGHISSQKPGLLQGSGSDNCVDGYGCDGGGNDGGGAGDGEGATDDGDGAAGAADGGAGEEDGADVYV